MTLIGPTTTRDLNRSAGLSVWRGRTIFFTVFLAIMALGSSVAAQGSGPDMNDPVVIAQGGNPVGTLIIYVVGADGKQVTSQGVVTIFRAGEVSGQHQGLSGNGIARFNFLANAAYTVIVTADGYKDAREEAEITPGKTMSEVTVTMERPDGGTSDPPDAKGVVLAPKAKQEAQKGIDAMVAGQYEEAQKHLNAAYKMAPGNPDLNDRMAELFLTMKNFDKAQTYLQKALSIEPDNASALTDLGWLHVQQGDNADAETVLQRAITADPQRWFTHWLLGLSYLRQGNYDSARQEAATAVKVGKGAAADAQYLLGESLALLGRNEDAIKALQDLVKSAPDNSNVASARILIAKLEASGTQALVQSTSSVAPTAAAASSSAPSEKSQ